MSGPATEAMAVDLSLGDFEATPGTMAIHIGWGGHLTVQFHDGTLYRMNGLKKGNILPLRIARILKRGTTCRRMTLLLG